MIESPASFIVSTECELVADRYGFRRKLEQSEGWQRFESTTAQGSIYLAAAGQSGPWFLALDHPGVIEELGIERWNIPGPGLARYEFENLAALHRVMPRIYELSMSLPDAPLLEFQAKTDALPRSTEGEQLVVRRIGQDIFRDRLLRYWQHRCPLTGIVDPQLLRASHIVPWRDCATDADRLDVHNGLLLSALWDAAFDKGLVTFSDDGVPEYSSALSALAKSELRWTSPINLTPLHRQKLQWHRTELFVREPQQKL